MDHKVTAILELADSTSEKPSVRRYKDVHPTVHSLSPGLFQLEVGDSQRTFVSKAQFKVMVLVSPGADQYFTDSPKQENSSEVTVTSIVDMLLDNFPVHLQQRAASNPSGANEKVSQLFAGELEIYTFSSLSVAHVTGNIFKIEGIPCVQVFINADLLPLFTIKQVTPWY